MTGLFLILSVVVCSAFTQPLSGKSTLPELEGRRQSDYNAYYLYTRRNPTSAQNLVNNNVNSITSSNFNARNPIVVIVHGWLDNMDASFNGAVRGAYLRKTDVNLIMCDWSAIAIAVYGSAVTGVPIVGRNLGQFLNFLHRSTGAPFNKMHIVGFSLGSHVAGNAGRELGGKIARITGLDPAGPLWHGNSNRLRPSDAVYVEAIHSDGSAVGLGIGLPVGDVDFFPNGGASQPGCFDHFCNHNRAWQLFAATLTYNHLVGRQCSSMMQVNTNNCRGNELRMGNHILDKRGSGLYRVNTGRVYPF
ncbi:pancreatic triacylglycerol lipase-like isoform X1 [Maniola jurtina]|uniref:pancreatic triacylglycerol lipase-like isoform X1 n=1 Tax=Maniola jurtina TaxID=191418 RepID=UPI001E68BA1F|nr:pancreatic triacylglycerol lipase-like isoform X1 [Maniola jurtina]